MFSLDCIGTELSPNNALGAESPNNAPTEIDQEVLDPSGDLTLPGPADLEPVDESSPGALKRSLQFDAAACGLDDGHESIPESYHGSPETGDNDGENDDENDIQTSWDQGIRVEDDEDGPEVVENGHDGPDEDADEDAGDESMEVSLDKEVEKSEREYKTTLAHRKNSTAWHQKWISKGVPRTEENKGVARSVRLLLPHVLPRPFHKQRILSLASGSRIPICRLPMTGVRTLSKLGWKAPSVPT